MVREVVRSLLDLGDVFGRYTARTSPDAEVVLIDSEMPLDNLQAEYRAADVRGLDRLRVASIKGCERSFDVRVPEVRARWVGRIEAGSVIVFDCLYSVLAALGISENDDGVAAVLLGLRALATESGAVGLIVVHHLGKDSERGARGHSSIEGFPDVLCRNRIDGPLGADPERIFSAYGRGVSIESAVLTLGADHRLTTTPRAEARSVKRSARFDADDSTVFVAISDHPGLSGNALAAEAGLPVKRTYAACKRLAERGVIGGEGSVRPAWHAVPGGSVGDPFSTPSDVVSGTFPHRLRRNAR